MRIVKILALILVVAVLFGGWMYMNKLEKEDKLRMEQLYSQAEPLEKKKQELPKRKRYNVDLPGFVLEGLLKANNVNIPAKQMQLRICVRTGKKK